MSYPEDYQRTNASRYQYHQSEDRYKSTSRCSCIGAIVVLIAIGILLILLPILF